MSDPGFACCTPLTGTAMSVEQAEQVAPLLKALADPVRLRLVSLIASAEGREACVCDLNEAFDLTQATISHHLKVLHSAGILDREKRGVWVYYAVRPEALTAVANLFTSPALAGADA
ncbi:metalloregulator ArsR/SmtB family transcription factor [Geodermatophilus nigrescens]